MSNFINQLAKGFVRSAINQVGRDGGRVISNQLYNGKNYIPIARMHPNDNTMMTPDEYHAGEESTQIDTDMQRIPSGAVSITKPLTAGRIIWYMILSALLYPFGTFYVLIRGIVMACDKEETLVYYETQGRYVSDRRYKSGSRYVGSVRIKHKMKIRGTSETNAINKRNGIISIAISLVIGISIFLSFVLK